MNTKFDREQARQEQNIMKLNKYKCEMCDIRYNISSLEVLQIHDGDVLDTFNTICLCYNCNQKIKATNPSIEKMHDICHSLKAVNNRKYNIKKK